MVQARGAGGPRSSNLTKVLGQSCGSSADVQSVAPGLGRSSRSNDVSMQLRRVGPKGASCQPAGLTRGRAPGSGARRPGWRRTACSPFDDPHCRRPGGSQATRREVPGARELCAPPGTRVYTNLVACLRHRRRTLRARPGGMATGLRCATGKGRPMWPASKWERRTWTCLNFDAPHVGCA